MFLIRRKIILDNKIILSVKNLCGGYYINAGYINVLKNVNIEVKEGESFAIVGQSGSGKSTLALAIMGLLSVDNGKITNGRIELSGLNLISQIQNVRGKDISIVFQDPHSYLNPVIKVGCQVREAVEIYNENLTSKEIDEKIKDTFAKVKLDDFERIYNSYPHQLSGGQKQRILIAMAVINNPKVLIADEPTSGLDSAVQKQILDLFEELKRRLNLTLIIITHDILTAKKFADTTAVMYRGEIVETGSSSEIFSNPQHEYTKLLCEYALKRRRCV